MYPLLIEELARERERALLREAGERRLAAQVAARRRSQEGPAVGVLRRVVGRVLISVGNRVAGGVRSEAR
jgi:hypothetical protein